MPEAILVEILLLLGPLARVPPPSTPGTVVCANPKNVAAILRQLVNTLRIEVGADGTAVVGDSLNGFASDSDLFSDIAHGQLGTQHYVRGILQLEQNLILLHPLRGERNYLVPANKPCTEKNPALLAVVSLLTPVFRFTTGTALPGKAAPVAS